MWFNNTWFTVTAKESKTAHATTAATNTGCLLGSLAVQMAYIQSDMPNGLPPSSCTACTAKQVPTVTVGGNR